MVGEAFFSYWVAVGGFRTVAAYTCKGPRVSLDRNNERAA